MMKAASESHKILLFLQQLSKSTNGTLVHGVCPGGVSVLVEYLDLVLGEPALIDDKFVNCFDIFGVVHDR